MAKQKTLPYFSRFLISFAVIIVILFSGIYFTQNKKQETSTNNKTQVDLLVNAAVWYPSAPWTPPAKDTQNTFYGTLEGESITATVTSKNPMLNHFEMVNELSKMGFEPDNNLAADGPGSSSWGYKKIANNMLQIMLFSYKTKASNSNLNEPLQFNCPCKIDVTVFVSNEFSAK